MLKSFFAGLFCALVLGGTAFAQSCPAYTYTLTNGTTADANQVMANFNTVRTCVNSLTGNVLRGYIAGLTLSAAGSSATFGISSGVATDSTIASSMTLASAYSKTTSAWAVGSTAGCLDSGTITNTTWYSVFLIQRTDTGVVDVLCSTSATSPALPSPYTLFRRVGSMRTDGSAQWRAFSQNGDEFLWSTPIYDVNTNFSSTTLFSLTVPSGLLVNALFNVTLVNSSSLALVTSPASGSPSVSYGSANIGFQGGTTYGAGTFNLRTNTSGQIAAAPSAGTTGIAIQTLGWIDSRGKNN